MAYNKNNWKDHIVERPRTYTEVTNGDGTKTLTPSPGEILQQGTPQSATNFNRPEVFLQHLSIAFDMAFCIMQSMAMEMDTMREQLDALVNPTET